MAAHLKVVTALAFPAVLALLSCCSSAPTAAERARTDGDAMYVQVVAHNDDGSREDLGMHTMSRTMIAMTKAIPMSGVWTDERGRVTQFTPAFPPVDGVSEPGEDESVASLHFNAHGRLDGWTKVVGATGEPVLARHAASDPQYYFCTGSAADGKPSHFITYVPDAGGGYRVIAQCPDAD